MCMIRYSCSDLAALVIKSGLIPTMHQLQFSTLQSLNNASRLMALFVCYGNIMQHRRGQRDSALWPQISR
ncbi:hypothetical protein HDF14_005326 [Edaphobacter lichenicola]|uniref:Uncharacterized protein n=1 Tax=Tunturiibacter gelidiferens TaxID=3069689 RepID=A0A9X0QJJ6_9BACT|nr:hypothetical protein [Edaphobacter lichenicola]